MSDNEIDPLETPEPVQLTVRDLRQIQRALKIHETKLSAKAAKSTFVPEPGKNDVTKMSLEHVRQLRSYILSQLKARTDRSTR